MPYVDYLSRNPVNEVEEPEEVAFVGNVAYEITKFGLAFIYNYYGPIMSIRTRDYMKGLYQSPCEKQEPNDKTALDLVLRELRKETGLVVVPKRAKWVGIDKFYDCAIYTIELGDGKVPRWMEIDKNGPWEIIPWKQYVNYARMGQTTLTHSTHLNQLLEAAGRQGYAQPSVTFKDMVEGVYFDPADASYDMYEKEYE